MGKRPDSACASSSRSPTRRVRRSTSPSTFDKRFFVNLPDAAHQADFAFDHRQRSAQLVADIGDKTALAGKQPFQPAEGFIEGGDQLGDFFALIAH